MMPHKTQPCVASDPQGATVTRDHPSARIRLRLWWNGVDLKDQPSVELTAQSAVNLAIDLLLAARQEMKQ